MTRTDRSDLLLAARLLDGLSARRADGKDREPTSQTKHTGLTEHARNLFSYCSITRERLAAISLEKPILGVVMSGTKEIWRADMGTVLNVGTLFVLPAEVPMDVLNLPNPTCGLYQSLVVPVEPEALAGLAYRCRNRPASTTLTVSPVIRLSPALVDAVIHASSDIVEGPAGLAIRSSRLTELLAQLVDTPGAQPLFELALCDRLAQILFGDLSYAWTAPEAAAKLGLSESTLRRRLSDIGTSFRSVLRTSRMQEAARLIAEGHGSQDTALAVGYASRTHFARHFRAAFGANPNELRQNPRLIDATVSRYR